ncbi:MAG: TonB family protein, partial [Polyangiales bacterium]
MKTLTLAFCLAVSLPALAQGTAQAGVALEESLGDGDGRSLTPPVVDPVVRGSLSKEVIRNVIQRHINEVRYCYERALHDAPDLEGRVTVRFIIAGNGTVRSATAQTPPPGFAQVAACVVQRMRRWRFPAPAGGGIVVVNYPFAFGSTNASPPSTSPPPTEPEAEVRGSLPREVIRRVVRRHLNEARYCYERALQSAPTLAGTLTMRFVIAANGSVSAASANEPPPGFGEVERCLA